MQLSTNQKTIISGAIVVCVVLIVWKFCGKSQTVKNSAEVVDSGTGETYLTYNLGGIPASAGGPGGNAGDIHFGDINIGDANGSRCANAGRGINLNPISLPTVSQPAINASNYVSDFEMAQLDMMLPQGRTPCDSGKAFASLKKVADFLGISHSQLMQDNYKSSGGNGLGKQQWKRGDTVAWSPLLPTPESVCKCMDGEGGKWCGQYLTSELISLAMNS